MLDLSLGFGLVHIRFSAKQPGGGRSEYQVHGKSTTHF
jgi:hypothetical protein